MRSDAEPIALGHGYMNEEGNGCSVFFRVGRLCRHREMRAGEKHQGIRVQRVDGKGVVINGRHY